MSWRPRWFMRSVAYTLTPTGVKIIVYTNTACHLWCRLTTAQPLIHYDPVLVRGVAVRTMPRYCFTTYWDVEQEEIYDTHLHTFIVEPWPSCQTRWFYLFGTIDNVGSPSESPLLKYHRREPPTIAIFRPDPHPEVTSVDGNARRLDPGASWEDIHDGNGNLSDDLDGSMSVEIAPHNNTTWWYIYRCLITFDTSSIPPSANILEAKLDLHTRLKVNTLNLAPALGLYTSTPLSSIEVFPHDYHNLGDTLLASSLPYESIPASDWFTLTLNPLGISKISKGFITKFGLKEVNYDAANFEPTPIWSTTFLIRLYTADFGDGSLAPKLTVTYEE